MSVWNKETVKKLHSLLCEISGGSEGLRDEGLLESAIGSAYATFGGIELYPTAEEKAARLGFALASNHPFVDGNKRIGVLAMLTFLEASGHKIKATDEEIYDLGMALGRGELSQTDLLLWIESHLTV